MAVLVGVGVYFALRQRRSEGLRRRFGPEYDRAVDETGNREKAETVLEQRRRRIERLNIRPLTRRDSARYSDEWHAIQTRFVDDPAGAITEADRLVGEVMSARGYPVTDFNQRTADISVDHPRVVENYRAAHAIAQRHAQGQANTEDLRQAMIHYRALFMDLIGDSPTTHMPHAA
ncbi:hypothetical protein [Geomonas limicola]|uniref:hypothetical protein n=1 Tax=Geomonas limicola TaxID=2740186 RepID=UPI001FE6BCA9|nr:hypothetical protein [Geomonas limicola]